MLQLLVLCTHTSIANDNKKRPSLSPGYIRSATTNCEQVSGIDVFCHLTFAAYQIESESERGRERDREKEWMLMEGAKFPNDELAVTFISLFSFLWKKGVNLAIAIYSLKVHRNSKGMYIDGDRGVPSPILGSVLDRA